MSTEAQETSKKSEAEKTPRSAIFALVEALRQANYTITLRPVNGHILQVIRAAA